MYHLYRLLITIVPLIAIGCVSTERTMTRSTAVFPEVTLQGDRIFVGQQPFLVVAIGYETGARPGQLPWERPFQPDLLRKDFERIRAAGFNTLRTWAPMTDAELELAAEYDLWVIQGLWFDPGADFNDPAFRQKTFDFVRTEVTRSAKHPNILFYLLLNEPHADAVYRAGLENMQEFYRQLLAVARAGDPKRFFSYSNCVATDFMPPEMWDLVALNAYPYSPVTIERALGYRTYLEIIQEKFSLGKPMVITEFGLSVSPRGDGRGYGGNTLEKQRDGVVELWDDILNDGLAGGCAFMWIDGWHKYGDEKKHTEHAEEWYGLLEADHNFEGNPRPVYYALKEYNQALLTAPRDGQVFGHEVPVTVWAPEMKNVQMRLDDGTWQDMSRRGDWWKGSLDVASAGTGLHYVRTRGINQQGEPVSAKYRIVRIHSKEAPGLIVRFIDPPKEIPDDQPMKFSARITDAQGHPLAGKQVQFGRFLHTEWNEFFIEADTDANGVVQVEMPALHRKGIASIAAGAVFEDGLLRRRFGDYIHVELK
jgi:hypothetical protein